MKKVESLPYALLAFFLGDFGIHKFYVNDRTKGFLYLVFSLTGIPGIIAFFTAINALLNTEKGLVYLNESGSIVAKNNLPKNRSKIKSATDLKRGEKPFYQTASFWIVLVLVVVIIPLILILLIAIFASIGDYYYDPSGYDGYNGY